MEMPPAESLSRFAVEVSKLEGKTYVHCANGHGRSALVVAMVMMLRGDAANVPEAFRAMAKKRSVVNCVQGQRDTVNEAMALLGVHCSDSSGAIELPSVAAAAAAATVSTTTTAASANDDTVAAAGSVALVVEHTGRVGPDTDLDDT